MNASKAIVSIWAVTGLLASTAVAVDIETVGVGDRGNTADKRYTHPDYSSPGAVAYAYSIGKYEVTAGQYASFLNAVAGMDLRGLYNVGMAQTNLGCGITRSGTGTTANPFTYSVAAGFVNRPVTYVSWGDAARFANWLRNGQPTGKTGSDHNRGRSLLPEWGNNRCPTDGRRAKDGLAVGDSHRRRVVQGGML